MGICEALTIIFVICKLLKIIDWTWWQVFIPEFIAGCVYIMLIVRFMMFSRKIDKKSRKLFNDMWK